MRDSLGSGADVRTVTSLEAVALIDRLRSGAECSPTSMSRDLRKLLELAKK